MRLSNKVRTLLDSFCYCNRGAPTHGIEHLTNHYPEGRTKNSSCRERHEKTRKFLVKDEKLPAFEGSCK